MDSSYPDPSLIGKAFVKQYYTQLHHDPSQMHRFYLEQSSMVHGGSELGSAERVIGQKAIHEKILSMDLQRVHCKIKQVDSDLTLGQGITIQVTGELSTAGRPMRAFVQTFVLAPESPKKYYVRNDFFRYQDDDLVSESETNESPGEGESMTTLDPPQEHMDTYHHQQSTGGMSSDVMKEDNALYGSPGADRVSMGDQVLPEDGSSMGAASSWDQYPSEPSRLTEIQQNGLPSEEEAVGDVPASQTTPMAPPTSSGGAAQPELPLQEETDGPSTESEAYSMETQEPETGKGTWADRLSRGFGTSAAPKPMSSIPISQSATRPAAPPTAALPQRDPQRKRMDRTPIKDTLPRKLGGGGGGGSGSRDMPDACQLFVGGLPNGTTEADLRVLFSEFGDILEIRVNQKNFAFIVFNNSESVQKVLAEKESIQLRSKPLNIELKRPSAPRSGGMGRGKPGLSAGGGGGGGGGKFRSTKPAKR